MVVHSGDRRGLGVLRQKGERKGVVEGATAPSELETEEYWQGLPTLAEIREAIPDEYFKRSLAKSMGYLLYDGVKIALIMYLGTFIPLIASTPLRWAVWTFYWYVLGTVATGWWVLAHEAGHQGFSPYRRVNHLVGTILHTILLVPYHPWRISHGLHHKYNMDMARDQVFIPAEKTPEEERRRRSGEGSSPVLEALMEAPLVGLLFLWTLGWPMYLLFNLGGQKYPEFTSHFYAWSPIFKPEQRPYVWESLAALGAWFGILGAIAYWTSPFAVLVHYFMPYLWVNFYLVTITYLQHSHEELPHFRGGAWNYVRGAVGTIDRSYGWFVDHSLHHIGDSHVAHHLFSTMPFYGAKKATPIIKKVLGKYYKEKPIDFIFLECYRTWAKCQYVSTEGDIVLYRTFAS